jgi:hypothetical protein
MIILTYAEQCQRLAGELVPSPAKYVYADVGGAHWSTDVYVHEGTEDELRAWATGRTDHKNPFERKTAWSVLEGIDLGYDATPYWVACLAEAEAIADAEGGQI